MGIRIEHPQELIDQIQYSCNKEDHISSCKLIN